MWFKKITGFSEESPYQVRENISLNGNVLTSSVNGADLTCGTLEIISLANLRKLVSTDGFAFGKISVSEVIANIQKLHVNEFNSYALFQVASQFNLLEMATPNLTPEHGVDIYENDYTQGPACAIAAGAGTIYRNYFANVNGQIGQTTENQIDCLMDIGVALGNTNNRLWEMKNGYALFSHKGLIEIQHRLKSSTEIEFGLPLV